MSILTSSLLMMAAAGSPAVNCADPVTQTDMTRCAVRDFEAADAALNRQWQITSDAMKDNDRRNRGMRGPGYFAVLLDAQRAWLKFRDTHCISAGYMARGGTLEPMLVANCRTTLTQERTAQLREIYDNRG